MRTSIKVESVRFALAQSPKTRDLKTLIGPFFLCSARTGKSNCLHIAEAARFGFW